ncbi:MAG: hypothetical protein QNJ89_03165 [Acidimicrobiia bacterium]|nr:hypothetical protein [Acidimicrobiia bacterium]
MKDLRPARITKLALVAVIAIGLMSPGVAALEPGGSFVDDNGSVHEASIEAIADEGITVGCNPPVNDRFCPEDSVSRGQMATFLVRALGLPAAASSFVDTADSVHEANIGALAAAGITQGCNPPVNDRFCPGQAVTRAQMATFLTRALDLTPLDPPDPLPAESPNDLVTIGTSNWLYFTETVEQACVPQSAYDRALAEIAKAKEVVSRSGRSFVYAVVPNKAAIYSDDVPGWDGSCAEANSDRLRQSLASAADPARIELWDPFLASSDRLYFKHDTHWNGTGQALGSELIAAAAAPGVWDQLDLVSSPASRQGDLAGLINVEWVIDYNDVTPTLSGVDPVVTVEPITIVGRPLVTYASPSRPELSSSPTAIIHDSFGLFFRNKLGPLFEDATFLPTFSHPIPDAARPLVSGSEQVVFEIAERNVLRDFIGTGTAGHLAAAFADDFAQTPVTYDRDGSLVSFDVPGGDPGDLRYLIVTLDTASTVVLHDLYDVIIDPSEGAWPNEITPDASRYGFEVMDTTGPTVIPLPESITVTEAFVITIG